MKKLAAAFAMTAAICSAGAASAAEGDYAVVLKEPAVVTNTNVTQLSDRVYLAPTYEEALCITWADNIESIFMDEPLEIPETEFDNSEYASLSEEDLSYPDGANDTSYYRQWYLPHIKAQSAWKNGLTGEGIKVGIIDTGINPVHVDLRSKTKNSFNCLSSDTANVIDTYGHGTMVAGIIAATTNNSKCVSGITSDVDLAVIKIAENDKSKPSIANLLAGITKAIEFDCDVVNMSMGWVKDDITSASFLAIKNEITRGTENGIIFVAASGNLSEGATTIPTYYPAAYDNVISVASLGRYKTNADKDADLPMADYNGSTILPDEPSDFSVHNNYVTCAAPGFRIASTFISSQRADGTYTDPTIATAAGDGTSFAAPMVASAAVIAKQLDPTINYARFEEYLRKSVRDVYTEGYDEYTGYGALDIEALIRVINEEINAPTPSPAPITGFSATITQSGNRYIVSTLHDAAVEDFCIIAAAYCNGRLVTAKSQCYSPEATGDIFSFTCDESVDTVAVMAWALHGIYPLTECVKQEFPTEAAPDTDDIPGSATNPTQIPGFTEAE